ncbi:unnamed protein product [Didymodactylos carnosus]|uniref:Cache 3/Cache 2 fusion domain-containing protein n=1 Tax=Didymodactylos carnosus TaxID=1234261 RepID=A0A815D5S3_9BILA|nr:unnamed protein product [Didymodactylos carnosus]CAF1297040.1 unnamed protein product [Didymodactylos carnosus]CAF3976925.1 unnamed protein product [Didymodactylos carnosus]CAF4113508.1 unnamed protein product [Didymodactylos carnosus]
MRIFLVTSAICVLVLFTGITADSNAAAFAKCRAINKKVHLFLNEFTKLAKKLNPHLLIGYNVQTVNDSNYVRGFLYGAGYSTPKDEHPGTVYSDTANLQLINQQKVIQGKDNNFLAVPFKQLNNQTIFYTAQSSPNSNTAELDPSTTTSYAIALMIEQVRKFYEIDAKAVYSYFVKDISINQYIRVFTTTPDINGHYATGESLSQTVASVMDAGKVYKGKVVLFGKNYIAVYRTYNSFSTKVVIGSAVLA